MILSDNETKVDLLNNETIALTIINLIKERPDHPITIGIHGDWGAGKSSILEMIEVGFEENPKILCLKFNGWRFQGFEDAKIALIEDIVSSLIEKRSLMTKAEETVKEIFRRIDWLKVAKKAGSLAFTTFTGIPTPEIIQGIVSTLQGFVANPEKIATKGNIESVINETKSLLKPATDSKNIPEEISEFQKAFKTLLKKAEVEQLVVLIDDLDRCLPETAIETLEAIRLFLFTERTAFVVAADEAMIEYAVRKHFPDLPESTSSQTYARKYLEKLIQVPFRIPALGETETRIYVTLLLIGAEIGENDPVFTTLISTAREKLRRPWTYGALDIATVRKVLGSKAPKVQNAMTLSDQIGPILASGTKGNPRQIKRFLNTLILRQRTATARGFGDEVKLPVLAKLMLAERFLPHVFDQIANLAASSPDGYCKDLALLETYSTSPDDSLELRENESGKTTEKAKISVKKEVVKESTQFVEWKKSSSVQSWAKVKPEIGNEDLRPYLFVTKDRKDYFGASSALGHLTTVAEQLLGSKFAVQVLESDLKLLAAPEAAQVFDLVRSRIIGTDTFDTEPQGVAGISVLVKTHPELQGTLLDFLETLPCERLGGWVCQGWTGIIIDETVKERFDKLLHYWSERGSRMLKITANGVLRTLKGGH